MFPSDISELFLNVMFVFEFSLNVFTEFSDKNNIILKRLLYSNLPSPVCEKKRLYHFAIETQLTEKRVKLILIHASVISQIP